MNCKNISYFIYLTAFVGPAGMASNSLPFSKTVAVQAVTESSLPYSRTIRISLNECESAVMPPRSSEEVLEELDLSQRAAALTSKSVFAGIQLSPKPLPVGNEFLNDVHQQGKRYFEQQTSLEEALNQLNINIQNNLHSPVVKEFRRERVVQPYDFDPGVKLVKIAPSSVAVQLVQNRLQNILNLALRVEAGIVQLSTKDRYKLKCMVLEEASTFLSVNQIAHRIRSKGKSKGLLVSVNDLYIELLGPDKLTVDRYDPLVLLSQFRYAK